MMLKRLLAAILLLWSTAASAAFDWCGFAALEPSNTNFEAIGRTIDGMGCTRVQERSPSAHARFWDCTDTTPADVRISLMRFVERGNVVILGAAINQQDLGFLDRCGQPQTRTTRDAFDAASVLVRDRRVFSVNYRRHEWTLLRSLALSLMLFSGSGYGSTSSVTLVEQAVWRITRPISVFTSVRIAGQDPANTTASDLVTALTSRGARIIRTENPTPDYSTTVLSAPIGLEGVEEVTVFSGAGHIGRVEYKLRSLPDYTTYIQLLDETYGRSSPRTITESGPNRGCRVRSWQSGVIEIGGFYCEGQGHRIIFFNEMVLDQLGRINEADRRMLESNDDQPSNRLRIDPDNI